MKKCLAFSLLLISCTKGVPVLEGAGVELSLDSVSTTITSTTATVTIQGSCDPRMSDVEISLDGGVNWSNFSSVSSSYSVDCSGAKRFSVALDLSVLAIATQFAFVLGQTSSHAVKLRAVTVIGPGDSAQYIVEYLPALPIAPPGKSILAGNSDNKALLISSGASFYIRNRIGVQANGSVSTSSGGNFVIKSGLQRVD